VTEFFEPASPDFAALRRPALGYSMAVAGATLFAVNGTVSKVILRAGLAPGQLTEFRSTVAFVVLLVGVVAAGQWKRMRARRSELALLAVFGAAGFTFVQWCYFIALVRLPVGVALIIEYLAPVLVTLYARLVLKEQVRARMWVGLVLALAGLSIIAQVWSGSAPNPVGLLAGLGAAVSLSIYYLAGQHMLKTRDSISLTTWGFGFSAVVCAVLAPWWDFPFGVLSHAATLTAFHDSITTPVWVLGIELALLGTVGPFLLVVGCLRHLRASQAGIVGMTEPVLAAVVAFFVLGESLSPVQLIGGAIVLTAVVLAESAR